MTANLDQFLSRACTSSKFYHKMEGHFFTPHWPRKIRECGKLYGNFFRSRQFSRFLLAPRFNFFFSLVNAAVTKFLVWRLQVWGVFNFFQGAGNTLRIWQIFKCCWCCKLIHYFKRPWFLVEFLWQGLASLSKTFRNSPTKRKNICIHRYSCWDNLVYRSIGHVSWLSVKKVLSNREEMRDGNAKSRSIKMY